MTGVKVYGGTGPSVEDRRRRVRGRAARALPSSAHRGRRAVRRSAAARELHRARLRVPQAARSVRIVVDRRRSRQVSHRPRARAARAFGARHVRGSAGSSPAPTASDREAVRARYTAGFMEALAVLARHPDDHPLTRNPFFISNSRTRSRRSPCSSIAPSSTAPPVPQLFLSSWQSSFEKRRVAREIVDNGDGLAAAPLLLHPQLGDDAIGDDVGGDAAAAALAVALRPAAAGADAPDAGRVDEPALPAIGHGAIIVCRRERGPRSTRETTG